MSAASRPSTTAQSTGWLFARGQRKGGPVSFQQLQQWAAVGKLLPSDHVLEPGPQKWQAAEQVPGLFGGPGRQTAVPPMSVDAVALAPPTSNRLLGLALIGAGARLFLVAGLVLDIGCGMG